MTNAMIPRCEVEIVKLSTNGPRGPWLWTERANLFDDLVGAHHHEGEHYK